MCISFVPPHYYSNFSSFCISAVLAADACRAFITNDREEERSVVQTD